MRVRGKPNRVEVNLRKQLHYDEYAGTYYYGPAQHRGVKSEEEIAAAILASLDDKYVNQAGGYRGGYLEDSAKVGWQDFTENPRTKGAVAFVRVVGGVATIVTSGGATLPLVIGTYETFRGTDDGVKIVAEEITGEEYRGVAESGLDAFTEDEETSNKILFWLDSGVMIVELGNGVRMAFRKAKPGASVADEAAQTQFKNVDEQLNIIDNDGFQLRRTENDIAIDGRPAPPAKSPRNRGFQDQAQKQEADTWADWAESEKIDDFRVDQTQIGPNATRVGENRPDMQFTLSEGTHTLPDGTVVTVPPGETRRIYVEFDTPRSGRGPLHFRRLIANDPNGIVILRILPNPKNIPILVAP